MGKTNADQLDTGRVEPAGVGQGCYPNRTSRLERGAVNGEPVVRDASLGGAQRQGAGADPVVSPVLEAVLLVEAWRRAGGFGEEVRPHVAAARLERDEVVNLVGGSRVSRDPVRAVDGCLGRFAHVAHRAAVARAADDRTRRALVVGTGRAAWVGQAAVVAGVTDGRVHGPVECDRGAEVRPGRSWSGRPAASAAIVLGAPLGRAGAGEVFAVDAIAVAVAGVRGVLRRLLVGV